MAAWHAAADSHKQEEAVLHDQSSNARVFAVASDYNSKNAQQQFRPPPSRSWSDAHRSRQKRRSCLCAVVVVAILVIIACGISIPVALKDRNDNGDSDNDNNNLQALTTACNVTLYPTVCVDSLRNFTKGGGDNNPQQMARLSLQAAAGHVTEELTTAEGLYVDTNAAEYPQLKAALKDCVEFIQSSLDELNETIDGLASLDVGDLGDALADLETWMSAALTNQESCSDGFDDMDTSTLSDPVADFLQKGRYSAMLLSNVLAFVSRLQNLAGDIPSIPGHRRLMAVSEATEAFSRRRLLATTASSPSTADAVVAQDGSGKFSRIQDAVNSAPLKITNKTQYVIYIKAGKYVETVLVPKNANNLVFLGAGVGKTVISGNRSVIGSNVTTSATATLTVQGKNFVGQNFTVENTAGAAKQQAVAMRVTGDYAAFQNCQFSGFQDTLYTHTNRQFYTNCTIVGTVDFIFGNAAVVFQSSQILASTGLPGQQNTYTASGRTDPNENTGIVFQNCTFDGTASLKKAANGTFLTYLGRPWKTYARTVVMESVQSALLAPAGWLAWNGVTPSNSTIYYGEYKNTGPGSATKSRVSWSSQISQSSAKQFTVDPFIQGRSWLPQANITYIASI